MSSGGGSTQTQSTELPAWLQDAAQANLGRADLVSKIGYVPQYGIDVAGFTPMQQSAMQNTANAASAFGLSAPTDAMAGMPAQQTNNLGFSGYSSGDLFNNYLSNFAQQRPAQYAAQQSMFVDPLTGDVPIDFSASGGATYNPDAVMSLPTAQGYQSESDYTAQNPTRPFWQTAFDINKATSGLKDGNLLTTLLFPVGTMAQTWTGNYLDNNPLSGVTSNGMVLNTNGLDTSGLSGQGTTIYSGNNDTGIGNAYYSDAGNTWSDYGGYTGVSGTGSSMGNDWENF